MSIFGKFFRNNNRQDEFKVPTARESLNLIVRTLKKLNCDVKTVEAEGGYTLSFSYQSGYFRIQIFPKTPYIELAFFNIYSVPTPYLGEARQICNDISINTEGGRMVYSIDADENCINFHYLHSLFLNEENARFLLQQALMRSFYWQRVLVSKAEEVMEATKKNLLNDLERTRYEGEREIFLLREQEKELDEKAKDWRETKDAAFTLQQWMEEILDIHAFSPVSLSVITEEKVSITDEKQIRAFTLANLMIGTEHPTIGKTALLDLTFQSDTIPETDRHAVFFLHQDGVTPSAIYYRVTATLMPLSLQPARTAKDNMLTGQTQTVLIAYDLRNDKQLHDEFLYFWKEAKSKLENGKENELTEEEAMIAYVNNPLLGIHIYHGKRLFLEKRYAEASLSLKNSYKMLTGSFTKSSQHNYDLLIEVAYHIGFCYMELGQMEKALYYLHTTLPNRNTKHLTAYINCLIALHDGSTKNIIDGLIEEIRTFSDNGDEEKPLPDELFRFQNFLLRHKTLILIEEKDWRRVISHLDYLRKYDTDNLSLIEQLQQRFEAEKAKEAAAEHTKHNPIIPDQGENTDGSTNDSAQHGPPKDENNTQE